jgi:RNA polymerase sigma factor (sigma-70 family)
MAKRQKKLELREYLVEIENTIGYFSMQASKKAGLDLDDARQEMLIQAWRAYETFDPSKAKFTTYAGWRMKNRIRSLIKRNVHKGPTILIEDSGLVPDPKSNVVDEVEKRADAEDRESALNEIEHILSKAKSLKSTRENELACRVLEGLRQGKSLSSISKEEGVQLPRISTVFTRRIKNLGTREARSRIVKQIEEIETKSAKSAKEKKMATKKAEAKATRKGGMNDKIEFVRTNFVTKGKTRSDAIAGLQAKYPDMSANYAKTLVYGKMKDEKFAKGERKAAAKPAGKKGAKKAAPAKKTPKAAVPATKKEFEF